MAGWTDRAVVRMKGNVRIIVVNERQEKRKRRHVKIAWLLKNRTAADSLA